MRNRSNSGVRLDYFKRMVTKTILKYQNPITGLLPSSPDIPHAWVRDNVYSVLGIWGLALAYRKTADLDEDRAKAYELEQSVVKLMRGLLMCMMKQIEKVEKFKYSQLQTDSLHAKYDVATGNIVVGDDKWGHLQLDATSLYLLILAQMTASGLSIIYSLDEVAFIQNLVFYIQSAYRTPDFGIWERGDKMNTGIAEVNATSIGMAKAALEAMNELDLFGARGGPSSVIHAMSDEAQQCQAILHSVLPRESNSKETDAGLLSIISYPAFAVDDQELIDLTRNTIIEKLRGHYGFCRFLRDGYMTPYEDTGRLYYEDWELEGFENVECEWPMFYCYLIIDGLFRNDTAQVEEYAKALEEVMIKKEDGLKYMPELYAVPRDKADEEKRNPKSQKRVPLGKLPQMWGQSLYVLASLVREGFLSPGELDPLNRRLTAEPRPDNVVQVVILAEDSSIQEKLNYYDIRVQTIAQAAPVQLYAASVLSSLFAHLGNCKKLKLTGRPSEVVGVLATSKLYTLGDQTLAFFPQFVDQQKFYLPLDTNLLLDMFKTDIQYLGSSWKMMGRPLMVIPIRRTLLDITSSLHPAIVATIKKLQTGYISGTRVVLGNLSDFKNTSCVTNLTFLTEAEDSPDLDNLLKYIRRLRKEGRIVSPHLLHPGSGATTPTRRSMHSVANIVCQTVRSKRKNSVAGVTGIIRRTCSIQIDPGDIPENQVDFSCGSLSPSTSIPTSPGIGQTSGWFSQSPQTDAHPHLKGDGDIATEDVITSTNEKMYEGIDCDELIEQLKESDSLHEQADIIHYLFTVKGADYDTGIEGDGKTCRVRDLLTELYDKAGHAKQWWLVRHTAGMLRKKVEDLAKAATDIIVRQKQLAVGLPPEPREKIITRPLPPDDLANIIHQACGDDNSTAMLTQEILVYLAMFIRTEPKLFNEMLRIRVGLIIHVMASELARTLKCSSLDASDQLLNLSPFEMKTLLHHILSGKEFSVSTEYVSTASSFAAESGSHLSIRSTDQRSSKRSLRLSGSRSKHNSGASPDELKGSSSCDFKMVEDIYHVDALGGSLSGDGGAAASDGDRQGQWIRRRRLDGALNRVPVGFYADMWKLLIRCHGIKIGSHELPNKLTREMTAGELKFALAVEATLNKINQPEYRQLMVEALMILCLIVANDGGRCRWHEVIGVDAIVHHANEIFIKEQREMDGDVTLCCGAQPGPPPLPLKCGGAAGICQNFYDSAPSGRYGTMSYMCRSVVQCLSMPTAPDGNLDCSIQ